MSLQRNICALYNSMKTLNIFLLIFLLVPYRFTVFGCSISDSSQVSETPHSISLQWDLTPDCTDVESGAFQILAKHRKYLACNERINGAETRLVTNQVWTKSSKFDLKVKWRFKKDFSTALLFLWLIVFKHFFRELVGNLMPRMEAKIKFTFSLLS